MQLSAEDRDIILDALLLHPELRAIAEGVKAQNLFLELNNTVEFHFTVAELHKFRRALRSRKIAPFGKG